MTEFNTSHVTDPTLPDQHARQADALARLDSYIEEGRQDPEQRVLYEEQVPVMVNLHDALLEHGSDLKGRIVLPTGVGKTVLFTEFVRATGLRTLVLIPTKLLLAQTEEAFAKFGRPDDPPIGKVWSEGKTVGKSPITLSTYTSFVKHTEDETSPYINAEDYDVIILDEAHRALGTKTAKALRQYPHVPQIGLTATDKYSEKKKLSSLLPVEIHNMSIREAVESSLISPFSVWVVETETDMSEVKVTPTNEYDQRDLQRTLNTAARNRVAAEVYARHFGGRKAIFYCSGIAHSEDMAEMLRTYGIAAESISGKLTMKKQQELKDAFADPNPTTGLSVLTNDKILAEGFDEQSVAAIFNLAPTLSYVRSQQRGGRGLRIDPSDPNKQAIIVEFVDMDYRKPPVLFSDPNVSGTAHLGPQLSFEDLVDRFEFNFASARIVTNPEVIEQMALSFLEQRQDKREEAPEGWLTLAGLTDNFNVAATLVKNALDRLKIEMPEYVDENSGRYLARGVREGTTTYYSHAVKLALEQRIIQPEVAPEGWLTSGQIGERYGLDKNMVYRRLTEVADGNPDYKSRYVDSPGKAQLKNFFSPQCVRQFIESVDMSFLGDKPPDSWLTTEQIAVLYGPNASQQALANLHSNSDGLIFHASMEAGGMRFYGPSIIRQVAKLLTPRYDWATIEGIAKNSNVEVGYVEKILEAMRQARPEMLEASAKLCFVDGKEIFYFTKVLSMVVAKRIAYERGEDTETIAPPVFGSPIEMPEDTPILIPHFDLSSHISEASVSRRATPITSQLHIKRLGQRKAYVPPKRDNTLGVPNTSYLNAMKRFKGKRQS